MLKTIVVVVLAFTIALATAGVAGSSSRHVARTCARPTAHDFWRLRHEYPRFRQALVREFGAHWIEAAIVSYGEGSWHSWATNGQYLGTFQMGSSERDLYGHGATLVDQVVAAARYWRRDGWSPWDCRP